MSTLTTRAPAHLTARRSSACSHVAKRMTAVLILQPCGQAKAIKGIQVFLEHQNTALTKFRSME
jgi:hypothetical protein